MKRQQICFYSPYFPNHFGGGEKHILDVARVVSEFADVYIAVSVTTLPKSLSLRQIKEQYQSFIGLDLQGIEFVETPLGSSEAMIRKMLWTGQFDQLFYVTDGSVFISLAHKNHLHFQIPFTQGPTGLWQKFKTRFWQKSNTNSHFTKSVITQHWPQLDPVVLHPMVDIDVFAPTVKKKKTIVSVGRFFTQLHSKRQDVLIDIFSKLPRNIQKQWQLQLIGSVEDEAYVKKLQKQAKGLNITFHLNATREELVRRVSEARIFWHAAGYEVDEQLHPESVEHFGVSTIEAMAAGVVPVVYFAGGQKEILGEEMTDLGWRTTQDCVKLTQKLIDDASLLTSKKEMAVEQAARFGFSIFRRRVKALFEVP